MTRTEANNLANRFEAKKHQRATLMDIVFQESIKGEYHFSFPLLTEDKEYLKDVETLKANGFDVLLLGKPEDKTRKITVSWQ